MAALAPSAFSTSTSSLRASQSQSQSAPVSYSDSPLTQLPTVDIPFDDLRRRMAAFTVKFDAFIEQGRKRVLEERNEYKARMSELNEEKRSTKTQITSLQSTLSTHGNVVAREVAEKNEMHASITKLEAHQANQMQIRDKLRQEIKVVERQIEQKIAAQREYAKRMDGQARLNGPELQFWETYLGCRIEGAGEEEKVKVVFVFPPRKGGDGEEEREAVFELKVPDSGMGGYEVVYTKPRLETQKVEKVVERLNETREIGVLLKGMRGLFGEDMK